jgi:hypothetical protein
MAGLGGDLVPAVGEVNRAGELVAAVGPVGQMGESGGELDLDPVFIGVKSDGFRCPMPCPSPRRR